MPYLKLIQSVQIHQLYSMLSRAMDFVRVVNSRPRVGLTQPDGDLVRDVEYWHYILSTTSSHIFQRL